MTKAICLILALLSWPALAGRWSDFCEKHIVANGDHVDFGDRVLDIYWRSHSHADLIDRLSAEYAVTAGYVIFEMNDRRREYFRSALRFYGRALRPIDPMNITLETFEHLE